MMLKNTALDLGMCVGKFNYSFEFGSFITRLAAVRLTMGWEQSLALS